MKKGILGDGTHDTRGTNHLMIFMKVGWQCLLYRFILNSELQFIQGTFKQNVNMCCVSVIWTALDWHTKGLNYKLGIWIILQRGGLSREQTRAIQLMNTQNTLEWNDYALFLKTKPPENAKKETKQKTPGALSSNVCVFNKRHLWWTIFGKGFGIRENYKAETPTSSWWYSMPQASKYQAKEIL